MSRKNFPGSALDIVCNPNYLKARLRNPATTGTFRRPVAATAGHTRARCAHRAPDIRGGMPRRRVTPSPAGSPVSRTPPMDGRPLAVRSACGRSRPSATTTPRAQYTCSIKYLHIFCRHPPGGDGREDPAGPAVLRHAFPARRASFPALQQPMALLFLQKTLDIAFSGC